MTPDEQRRQPLPRFGFRTALVAALVGTSLAACSSNTSSTNGAPPTLDGKAPSGFVDMNEVQVAYIGSAGGGTGTLQFEGNTYPFTVGGLGVGGIGISTIDAKGEVYNLARSVGLSRRLRPRAATAPWPARPASAISGWKTRTASSCT